MTNAELALLGLLAEQPRHGYEIEQIIEQRGMRRWTEIGFSSIYYLLKKLAAAGLIASVLADSSAAGPARRVYEITGTGQDAFREGIRQALQTPRLGNAHFLTGIANLPALAQEDAIRSLRAYACELQARLDEMHQSVMQQLPLPEHVLALFDYSLTLAQAELGWVVSYIKKLEDSDGTGL